MTAVAAWSIWGPSDIFPAEPDPTGGMFAFRYFHFHVLWNHVKHFYPIYNSILITTQIPRTGAPPNSAAGSITQVSHSSILFVPLSNQLHQRNLHPNPLATCAELLERVKANMRTPLRAWLSSFATMSRGCCYLDEIANRMSGVVWRWALSCHLFLIHFYISGLVVGMETRGEQVRKYHHLLLIPLYLNWCEIGHSRKDICIPAAKTY